MTELYSAPYELPAADLGPENPLPLFRGREEDRKIGLNQNVPEEDSRYMGWRTAWRVLPHRMQDGYNRRKRRRALDSLVLENDHLRAIFLPELGGRLASLYDKHAERELLARNPVFQPANLALRNAWFSGGIEWNTGHPGHHYLTCSPVFAARLRGLHGEPGLRLYEWDRLKCYPWQIDYHMPPDSRFLFARVRLLNPHDSELPMYWWTNMAVAEREDVRVIVPAETTFGHSYTGGLAVADLPVVEGRDLTYATRSPHAFDFFSRIPEGRRRWIAALDGQGSGLFETSTDRLRGRKLFCWGMGAGGRQWQEFLSAPGHAYIEIQAGLARTQMECIPMPAQAEWTWTEAFGLLNVDPTRVHGDDWEAARRAVDDEIERLLPRLQLDELHLLFAEEAVRPPEEMLRPGSGWAALERRRAARSRARETFPPSLPFCDESLGADQAPWLALLETGVLPERDARDEPGAFMTQQEWRALLEESARKPSGDHWLTWWHIGNARMEELDEPGAEQAWQQSIRCTTTGWALRNLAILAQRRGDRESAVDLMRRAWDAGPPAPALAVEYVQMLLDAGRSADVIDFVRGLTEPARSHERILLGHARAALATGDLGDVERVFEHEFATIREGEVILTDLWFACQAQRLAADEGVPVEDRHRERARRECPPPRTIDFRMSG